jgi:hypothetical protein
VVVRRSVGSAWRTTNWWEQGMLSSSMCFNRCGTNRSPEGFPSCYGHEKSALSGVLISHAARIPVAAQRFRHTKRSGPVSKI